jgi:hypothetical protein
MSLLTELPKRYVKERNQGQARHTRVLPSYARWDFSTVANLF